MLTPSSAPSQGAARLLILWHTTVCFFLFFYVIHVILSSLCYELSAGHFPPIAGLCVLPPFFRVGFLLFASPPYHGGSLPDGFIVGFPCLSACVLFQFALPPLAPPPCHADGTQEGFDGDWSRHNAFFVSPPPPHWRYVGRISRVVSLFIVSAFPSITFFAFFMAS